MVFFWGDVAGVLPTTGRFPVIPNQAIAANNIHGNVSGNVYGPVSGDLTFVGQLDGKTYNNVRAQLPTLNVGQGNFIVPASSTKKEVFIGNAYDLRVTGSTRVSGQFINDLVITGSLLPYGGIISKNGAYSLDGSSGKTILGNARTLPKMLNGEDLCSEIGRVGNLFLPFCFVWAPDGKHFAVLTFGTGEILIYAFDGSTPTLVGSVYLGELADLPLSLAWSVDGRYIAVVKAIDNGDGVQRLLQIYLFSGGNPQLVGEINFGSSAVLTSVGWAPDGRSLAFVDQLSRELKIYSFAGGAPVLTGRVDIGIDVVGDWNFSTTAWSPDGRSIAFISSVDGILQVYAVTGGDPVLLDSVTVPLDPMNVAWSPNGNYLSVAFASDPGGIALYAFSGSKLSFICQECTEHKVSSSCAWSPDGRYIAYTQGTLYSESEIEAPCLRISSFSNNELTPLGSVSTDFPYMSYVVAWAPQGHTLAALNYWLEGSVQIFSVNELLFSPVLTVVGEGFIKGDLMVAGEAKFGQTTINGPLTINAGGAKIGTTDLGGGMGMLTVGGAGTAGNNGGCGGAGEVILGGLGGPAGNGATNGITGFRGNGIIGIGAFDNLATKVAGQGASTEPLSYKFELSPTWTTYPLVCVEADVASADASAGASHYYHQTVGIALAAPDHASPLVNAATSYAYGNNATTIITETLPDAPTCYLDGNSLTVSLQAPMDGIAPYETAVRVLGPVIRIG